MVGATLGWSMAGAVTRQLEHAQGFELTFWRSAFTAISLILILTVWKGVRHWQSLAWRSASTWISAACWSAMFTAFMVALTLTPTANVLVTLAACPLLTALLSRLVWKQKQQRRTWVAIAVAGLGIAWMFGLEMQMGNLQALLGMGIALAVPIAAAIQWNVVEQNGKADAMIDSVLLGALLSCTYTLPLALPLQSSARDLAWLLLLGVAQLAVPCVMAVIAARTLKAAQISLLSQLEVVFGITLAWWLAGEVPAQNVLMGGALVLGALVVNSWLDLRQSLALRQEA